MSSTTSLKLAEDISPRDASPPVKKATMEKDQDKLLPLAPIPSYGAPSSGIHLKTYTAGEDGSRLAEMAREFGLERQRQPRNQVRARVQVPLSTLSGFVYERILDPSFADVRMRAIYSAHSQREDDLEGEELMGRLPSWREDEEEPDVDPHAHGMGGDLISAVLGIIKGMVGPAILYLPHGFANAGYVVAVPILILSTVLFLSSSSCLLESWKVESSKGGDDESSLLERGAKKKRLILSYPELAYRALGPTGETAVKIGIALMQSGVCLTYLIFVPQNLKASTLFMFGLDIPAYYFMAVMLLFQIPLSWIRDIRKLTITNLLANILILYGLITCLGFAASNAIQSDSGSGPLAEIFHKLISLDPFADDWFLFIGTSVLLFEGSITLLVPLQEAVYREEDRQKFPEVYQKVIFGIIVFYSFFGVVCWMSFGDDVRTVMTTSLPIGTLATTVQFAYSVAVIFTFPLQNFPSLEIACRSIASGMQGTCGKATPILQNRNVIASFLVCALAVVAICTMDNLDKVVSLMGSLLGCPLAFVFPPLIHNKLDPSLSDGRKTRNLVVAGLGVCAMVLASATTLLTW